MGNTTWQSNRTLASSVPIYAFTNGRSMKDLESSCYTPVESQDCQYLIYYYNVSRTLAEQVGGEVQTALT